MEREQMRIADEDGIRDDQTVKWNFEMVVGIVQSSGVSISKEGNIECIISDIENLQHV